MGKKSLSRKQQFRLLELLLIWEGSIQRKKIADTFNIALNHVTNVIREYELLCPNNLTYDQRKRHYSAGEKFKPKFCKGSPKEYLSMLKSQLHGMEDISLSVDILSHCCSTPTPEQNIKVSVLRALVAATLEGKRVQVRYQSLKEVAPSKRIVSPHSLVSEGHRWHARVFDHTREDFRDLVLHRILSAKVVQGEVSEVPYDNDWNNNVTLRIVPNELASDGQKEVIAKEYGMKKSGDEWRWDVSVKRCLVPYLVQQMHLDDEVELLSKHPVVLQNKSDVQELFFA